MGHEGMRASLVTRELIADRREIVRAHCYDDSSARRAATSPSPA